MERSLEDPDIWSDPEQAQNLGRERVRLSELVTGLDELTTGLGDSAELLEMAAGEHDEQALDDVAGDLDRMQKVIEGFEFRRMFSGEMDNANAFLDIQAGSGGTEAQDWAEMLLRMYLRWGERHGFKAELIEVSAGEVAGIKSATVRFEGPYAYGWLRTEIGVHRLVRKSPFDSGHRRHTSFAAVSVAPEIDDSFEVEINPADLRVDVYRASGAGGQHACAVADALGITRVLLHPFAGVLSAYGMGLAEVRALRERQIERPLKGAEATIVAALAEPGNGRASDLASALGQAARLVTRRGMVILISDLLVDVDTALPALRGLRAAGHDVTVLHVMDPAERDRLHHVRDALPAASFIGFTGMIKVS